MGEGVDATAYPRLAEYLALLPNGLDSYPECKSKAVMVSTAVDKHDLEGLPPGLPSAVEAMMRSPPSEGLWVPAVSCDAVFFAMVDAFYPTEEALSKWVHDRTMRTARSRVYRALTRLAGPIALLKLTSAIHRLFQKGTDLSANVTSADSVRLRLGHPPYLHWGLNHFANVSMFKALLSLSGALGVEVVMVASDPTEALYDASWK